MIQIEEQGNGVLFNGSLTDKRGWVLSLSSDQTKVVLTNRITGLSGSSDVTEVEVDGSTFADYDALVTALGDVLFRTGGSGPGTEPGGDASSLNGQPGSYYRSRANHTGTQTISTVSGLQAALNDRPTNSDFGTAAFEDSASFATAAQGAKADTAVQTETDPTVPAHVKSITSGNISNWNTAFGWGNHSSAGYWKLERGLSSEDLNDLTSPGIYFITSGNMSGVTNRPPYAENHTALVSVVFGNIYVKQEYIITGGSAAGQGIVWVRISSNNGTSWSAWRETWSSANFTPSNYLLASTRGATNGVASLDGSGKVPTSQLPDEAVVLSQFSGIVNDTLTDSETSASLNAVYPSVVIGTTVTTQTGSSEYRKIAPEVWSKKTIEIV